jgi:FkbM family methyltransferase
MILSDQIIVLGAGNLGRRVARAVRPVLFCDNKPSLWGSAIDSIPVVSPQDAVKSYPGATFVVAIWHPSRTDKMTDRIHQLKSLGAPKVIPFTELLEDFGDILLPNFLWQRRDYYNGRDEEIQRGRNLLDAAGREEFDRQMRLRIGDYSGQVIDSGAQYFPGDFLQLHEDEVFIDCGAYDGDTIAEFRRASRDHFSQIVAFEPDAQNFAALESAAHGDPRISLRPYAVAGRRETLRFAVGGPSAHISSTGSLEVQAMTLDEALDGLAPTYIKMDIEGSEPDALEGGRETITRHRPRLAVCLYHAPDHLWRIPFQLSQLLPNSWFTLRTYNADGLDCVCYCIPR